MLVPAEENQRIGRALLKRLNEYPDKPVPFIDFENLPDDATGMMMSNIQAAFKLSTDILGGYTAQYQFKLVYRVQPGDFNSRLEAEETLNAIGAWASLAQNKPVLEGSARVQSVRRDSGAALFAVYDDGSQDYQILMNLIYEVE